MRTLEVGAAVRQFNELAVPGMGSVWTGRQLLWPVLGIAAATLARATHQVSNIEAANAVEALACRAALASNKWKRDARIRGAQKLQGTEDLRFAMMRRPGFYVSQPMRMSAVQPLLALGLVESESERFNSYLVAEAGEVFLRTASEPFRRDIVTTLARWMTGESSEINHLPNLRAAITPLEPLPEMAAQALRERLEGRRDPNSLRRRAALAWVRRKQEASSTPDDWNGPMPSELAPEHWRDLRAGAAFFAARDAAHGVLDACEHFMGPGGDPLVLAAPLPESVLAAREHARLTAEAFLEMVQGQSYHANAVTFCKELAGRDGLLTLKLLVGRDGRVLRLSGGEIVAGMAFDGSPRPVEEQAVVEAQDGDEATAGLTSRVRLPANISFRVRNLLLLDLDLQGRLDAWLAPEAAA